ncbi:unnamed protein product, partial [Mesorhabditis spiculigera]
MNSNGKISFDFNQPVERKTSQLGWRGGISGNEALMNFCRVMVGTGVLALPLAYKQSGTIVAILLILFAGFFFTYVSCEKIVISALALAKRHGYASLDYGNVAENAFRHSFDSIKRYGWLARLFTNGSILLMQLGIAAVYTVFIKEHFEEIAERIFPSHNLSGSIFFGLALAGCCLIVMIRDLRFITNVSTFGNVAMTIVLIMVIQDLVRPPYASGQHLASPSLPSIIAAAGNVVYAFCSHAVVLPLANKMKEPKEMSGHRGVLSLGCSVVTILYALVGFFGYLKYGDAVRGSVTLNLPDTTFYFIIRIFLVLVVFTSYLIQHFVLVDMTWPRIQNAYGANNFLINYPGTAERMLCIVFVLAAFLLAVLVPDLGRITSLVGVTAGCFLGFIIPAAIHTATFLPEYLADRDYRSLALHMSTNCAFFICGIFFTIAGIYSNW